METKTKINRSLFDKWMYNVKYNTKRIQSISTVWLEQIG